MKMSSVDCVTELLAYTYHLVDQLLTQPIKYEQVSNNYQQLIQRAKASAQSATIPKNKFDQALFAIFAWIDETILDTGWEHKNEWIKHSLQKKFFNTTSAGVEFFDKLEKIDAEEKDLLEVSDYCLASGFRGRFYESHHQEKLNGIKANTRKKLTNDGDLDIPEILFPEAGDIEFNKRLKRKRWKGLSNFPLIIVLVPILLFLIMFYFFNESLSRMVATSGLL